MNILDYFSVPAAPTPIMKMAEICTLLGRVSIHRNSIDTGKMRRSSLDPTFLLA